MKLVTLRPIEMRDWERVHEWASTEPACRFQPWGPNSPEDSRQFVADALAAWEQDPVRRRVILTEHAIADRR
jgi:ribosomal-protein-alanine N-acetyltransferase